MPASQGHGIPTRRRARACGGAVLCPPSSSPPPAGLPRDKPLQNKAIASPGAGGAFPGAAGRPPTSGLSYPPPHTPTTARAAASGVPAKVTGQGEAEGLGPAFPAAPRPYLSPARGGEEDAAAEGRQEEFERRHLRAARLSGSREESGAGPG